MVNSGNNLSKEDILVLYNMVNSSIKHRKYLVHEEESTIKHYEGSLKDDSEEIDSDNRYSKGDIIAINEIIKSSKNTLALENSNLVIEKELLKKLEILQKSKDDRIEFSEPEFDITNINKTKFKKTFPLDQCR